MPVAMTNSVEAENLRLVYYCSGHGYGHATRVSALTCHLFRLPKPPIVHIVSSAPKHVFADSIALGALYRNADIDPVIVQPLAYRVDREKSRQALEKFLEKKPAKLEEEAQWLRSVNADCVLSDAAFLGCAAANTAGIPSVLITNFSFDSVYSYLSTPFVDRTDSFGALHASTSFETPKPLLPPDVPIPLRELEPLVSQLRAGYRCADLLLRLPGAIPIPSFATHPDLPSQEWVDRGTRRFTSEVVEHLLQPTSSNELWPQVPFPPQYPPKRIPRKVISTPLLVRSPDPSVYTLEGRSRFLSSIGVPEHLHDPEKTKILIVSFGGQVFHKPHSHSRTPSASRTPQLPHTVLVPSKSINDVHPHPKELSQDKRELPYDGSGANFAVEALTDALRTNIVASLTQSSPRVVQRPLGISKLIIPGAPPASIPNSPMVTTAPLFNTIPPTPRTVAAPSKADLAEGINSLLPDNSWIAIVCGVSQDWAKEDGEELPDSFIVAPKYVYMPNLTAVADVLLGKLGYGTVSECVDACTPFVYVSRPLFIEEHGLRLLLERDGVGVELSRESYEAGEWADVVQEAYNCGRDAKVRKRREGETGKRAAEGSKMATTLINWVNEWKRKEMEVIVS